MEGREPGREHKRLESICELHRSSLFPPGSGREKKIRMKNARSAWSSGARALFSGVVQVSSVYLNTDIQCYISTRIRMGIEEPKKRAKKQHQMRDNARQTSHRQLSYRV
ncbi:hypothetical protein AG1IA_03039 [Rhizoctonia solani AG-1 IA]|uniref:Uncharacterized protein n=1 Tax=Thanatephorus cucumeris (strain AG1-IA) TaxID=983506 RepID=L8WY49_THACA|nr:hypothetical protein AG1IA_03039 [Rhizoctonia solani AG-1 IA]